MQTVATITTRQAEPGDLLVIFKMLTAMHAESALTPLRWSPERAIAAVAAWIDLGCVIVAERGAEVVGMMCGSVKSPWYTDDLCVIEEFLYVRPDFRKEGVAGVLFDAFMAWAKTKGARFLRAGVSTGRGDGAERIYQSRGLRLIGNNFAMPLMEVSDV